MEKEMKKLYRSQSDRWLGGVCGGLGAYVGIDPTLIRILFVLLVIFGGGGGLLYILLWIFIPQEPTGIDAPPKNSTPDD
ncbi:MAG: PspC domain-containing protein [Chloroflexi bacterium]|nr:PspC domain-containing protein [Ardenticatenaceae bacterium]MBL1130073.1 PspC domain-containing protein [Chloroflexota bacterium]NOG36160.1 PspC domain-containing protein [Chloroflexota bacterium]GIK54889.1 MAG: PspC domain-containing protein [Chloroflexota bacterium]